MTGGKRNLSNPTYLNSVKASLLCGQYREEGTVDMTHVERATMGLSELETRSVFSQTRKMDTKLQKTCWKLLSVAALSNTG